ncbi:WD40 repeat domain-containing protein [Mesorhizobium sp. ASY16-5R]|uniref:WD40 repeat domain-containing protein n=1 Tax=Mesorhizobium sp. ASY16-5R TaxID=3445772 RepID=UPI003FA061F1
MNQQAIRNLTLFDLLARSWQRPSAVVGLRFSADGSSVAFVGADGTVAIAAVADQEPPESRIRVSGDLGQTTIRPRDKPPVPLTATAALADTAVPLAIHPDSGFLIGTAEGEVLHLAASGEITGTLLKLDRPVTAVDHHAEADTLAVGSEDGVFLLHGGELARSGHGGPAGILAFSPDGRRLASVAGDRLSILDTDAPHEISFPARAVSAAWSGDGAWLACGLEAGGLALVRTADGRTGIVPGFPSPVRTLCWSRPADALLASGAFRIAGWSMTAPPLDGDTVGALETGRTGLVPVEAVAAHPSKPLVAAGYANGRITVAQIGTRDELVVRSLGGAVTTLAWSGDGRHLAVGVADGTAAIITFPAQMFK